MPHKIYRGDTSRGCSLIRLRLGRVNLPLASLFDVDLVVIVDKVKTTEALRDSFHGGLFSFGGFAKSQIASQS
jgi:hypothetical protein